MFGLTNSRAAAHQRIQFGQRLASCPGFAAKFYLDQHRVSEHNAKGAGRCTGPHAQSSRGPLLRQGPAPIQETCFIAVHIVLIRPDRRKIGLIDLPPQIGPALTNEHQANAAPQRGGFSGVALEDGPRSSCR